MKRLTRKTSMGDYGGNGGFENVHDELQALRNRLGKYEDAGLEPEEIEVPTVENSYDFIEKAEKFEIPPEIEVKIPSFFIAAFAGELLSVFGRDVAMIDSDGDYNVWWYTGTGGWRDAFFAACKKLKLDWLNEYRESLEWYDSDCFDEIICERVCDFLNGNAVPYNSYCNYINEREKEHEGQN